MDIDSAHYTEWQIARIRLALNKYRIVHARNGYLPSWAAVRDAIIFCKANIERYRADPDNSFHAERLRRFAAGDQRLEPDKVADTARFLIQSGVLKPDELDESKSDLGQFLAAHQYLSSESEAARACVVRLAGDYAVQRKTGQDEGKTLLLRLIPDPSATFLRVEEVLRISTQEKPASRHRKDDDARINTRRVGYAFPITPLNVLHVFLGGFSPEQRVSYVQAGELCEETAGNGLFLMRTGEATGRGELAKDLYAVEPVILPNIYRFMPVTSEAGP